MASKLVNTRVRIPFEIRDIDGALYNPPSGKLSVIVQSPRSPQTASAQFDQSTYVYPTNAEIVHDDTGVFHVDVYGTVVGSWTINVTNTDSGNESADEFPLNFTASKIV